MKRLLFFLSLFVFSFPLYAQVATPFLDPTLKSEMPAAASWRYSNTLGINSEYSSGEITLEEEKTGEASRSKGSYLAAFQTGIFTLEAYHSPAHLVTYDPTADTDEKTTYKTSENQGNLAIRIGDFLSLGGTYHTIEYKTTDVSSDEIISKENQIRSGGGASLRIGESIFLGGGIETVTSSGSIQYLNANITQDKVSNSWMDTYAGVALVLGKPDATLFRVEVSQKSSPESKKSADEDKLSNHHNANTQVSLGAGITLSSFNFSYFRREETDTPVDTDTTSKTIFSRYGLGWVSPSGVVISLFGILYEISNFQHIDEFNTTQSGYQINLGYTF